MSTSNFRSQAIHLIRDARNPSVVAAIERLRQNTKNQTMPSYTVDDVVDMVEGFMVMRSPKELAHQKPYSEQDVVNVLGNLGSWLAKVHKKPDPTEPNNKVATDADSYEPQTWDLDELSSFLPEFEGLPSLGGNPEQLRKKLLTKLRRKHPPKKRGVRRVLATPMPAVAAQNGEIPLFQLAPKPGTLVELAGTETTLVAPVVPPGFETELQRFSKALGALIAHRPKHKDIARWYERTNRRSEAKLSFTMVATVSGFARINQEDTLDQVSDAPEFAVAATQAWDLLEISRQDAYHGLFKVLTAFDPALILEGAVAARVLWEAEMEPIIRFAKTAPNSPVYETALDREVLFVAAKIVASPQTWVLPTVGALSEGQMRRIAETAGLVRSERTPLVVQRELAEALQRLGLSADRDLFLPEAEAAYETGQETSFYEALERWASGEILEWESFRQDIPV
ncbi:MAG: hypothetical protein WC184_11330 [Acidimicrobiia bacterium]